MTFFKKFLIAQFVFLFSVFAVCADDGTGASSAEVPVQVPEQKAVSLSQIDSLISSGNYNDALRALTAYMSEHPDDFDRAQKRVDKVLKARDLFNQNAKKLVDMIKTGEGDQIEKLEKITALEKSEVSPTENVSEFTGLARRTVALGDVLISYNRIMHQGIRLIENGRFSEAALKFEEGFLIKNELSDIVFEEGADASSGSENGEQQGILVEYEKDITEGVSAAVKKIKELDAGTVSSQGFKALEGECENAYADFIRNIKAKNYDASLKSFERVRLSFSKLSGMRNSIMKEARELDRFDEIANERNPLLMGTSYITFYQRFVLGDETNANTGIIGAIDAFWNTRVESMKNEINEVVYGALATIQNEIPEDKIFEKYHLIEKHQKTLSLAKNFSMLAVDVQSLYQMPENMDGTTVGASFKDYEISMNFVEKYLSDLSLAYAGAERIALEDKRSAKSDGESGRIGDEVFSETLESVSRCDEIQRDAKFYLERMNQEKALEDSYFAERKVRMEEEERRKADSIASGTELSVRKNQSAGTDVSDERADFRPAIAYFVSVSNQNILRATRCEQNLWAFLAQGYLHNGNLSCGEVEDDLRTVQNYLDGKEEDNLVKKYPKEAKLLCADVSKKIAEEKELLVSYRAVLDGGAKFRGVDSQYDSGRDGIEELIKKLDSLSVRNADLAKKADSQVRLASIASDEGHSQYQKALAAFNRNDFVSANKAVESASEKFAESLDYQFDEDVRMMREDTLSALASKILAAENEKVIREVFALKEQASNYYYSSDFDAAENTLVKAQTLWSSVNAESDPEIEELLTSVKNIKSLEFGRIILSSDPHYAELSNTLNMAKLSFERGVAYRKQGDNDAAVEAFNVSLTNIRNVQNVYPLNKEARLINLKIQQELDPDGFPSLFEKQYRDAKANPKLNERLADLQDLYEVNPKYPGLAKDIYNLEEDLGMHPKKVVKSDARVLAQSRLSEAKALFNSAGDNDEKLSQALAKVNEAILLDSTNAEAKNVKLSIQLKIGNQATAILSQADEKLYAEAGRLFNQRKFEEANSVMNELWKSSAAKKSRKVIDLRNRIARRL